MKKVDNEAGVLYAKKGYYKGQEVTVTHHYGAEVWLEDYHQKGGETGCWVPAEAVSYKDVSGKVNKVRKR